MRVYKEPKTRRWYVDYFFGGRRIRYPGGKSKREAAQLDLGGVVLCCAPPHHRCGCSVGERLQTPTPGLP